MRLLDKDGAVLATGENWSRLVYDAWGSLYYPKCSAFLAMQWCVTDVDRMHEADVGTLEGWLSRAIWRSCPFDIGKGGQKLEPGCYDILFDMASEFWFCSTHRWYTRIGVLRALRKAAKEPIKTTEELARMWAAEMKLRLEEDND